MISDEEHIVDKGLDADPSYSKKEKFGNLFISLDSMRRRLMISRIAGKIRRSFQIPLHATRMISIKKVYKDIYVDQLRYKKLEDFLETIYLQFEFINGINTIHLPLFERSTDKLSELPAIEKRVQYCQDLLSVLRFVKEMC